MTARGVAMVRAVGILTGAEEKLTATTEAWLEDLIGKVLDRAAWPELVIAIQDALPDLDHEVEQREHSGNGEYVAAFKARVEALRAAVDRAVGTLP
jgi:hypothetical protein